MTPISDERLAELTRPIIGIENRTAKEVFDIMCDRIKAISSRKEPAGVRVNPLIWSPLHDYGADAEQARGVLPGIYGVFIDEDSAAGAIFAEWAASTDDFCMTSAKSLGRFSNWDEAKAAAQADYERRILASLEASPAPVSGVMAKPTVEQAIESLVSALDEMRSQQAKRDEFLATLIVNIEKNEPTADFAVNLREYVRNGRAALAAKGGQ